MTPLISFHWCAFKGLFSTVPQQFTIITSPYLAGAVNYRDVKIVPSKIYKAYPSFVIKRQLLFIHYLMSMTVVPKQSGRVGRLKYQPFVIIHDRDGIQKVGTGLICLIYQSSALRSNSVESNVSGRHNASRCVLVFEVHTSSDDSSAFHSAALRFYGFELIDTAATFGGIFHTAAFSDSFK
jgi:hypothetical protein